MKISISRSIHSWKKWQPLKTTNLSEFDSNAVLRMELLDPSVQVPHSNCTGKGSSPSLGGELFVGRHRVFLTSPLSTVPMMLCT